jgi:hypothetical protein
MTMVKAYKFTEWKEYVIVEIDFDGYVGKNGLTTNVRFKFRR